MDNDPSSSVSVSGITDEDLAALQQAGLLAGQNKSDQQVPSIDEMHYATQVAPAYNPAATPAPSSSVLDSLPSMDEISNYLTNLPVQAQRMLTNPAAFTEMLTGNNPLPEQAGFAASATGLPAQNPNSLFTPAGMAYNKGYESGEPVSIAAMGMPALAPAGRMLGSAAADRIMAGKSLIPGVPSELVNPQIMSAVKNKGGNWLQGATDRLDSLKYPIGSKGANNFDFVRDNANAAKIAEHVAEMEKIGYSPSQIHDVLNEIALNKWVDTKIKPYVRNEMGTPTDPVRELHEQGISHINTIANEPFNTIHWLKEDRQRAGLPSEGFAKSPQARDWENRTDQAIMNKSAGMHIKQGESASAYDTSKRNLINNPWLRTVPPETPVHSINSNVNGLGFEHLTDELKNAIAHNSDLPAHLRLKPEALDRVSVTQAVKRVHDINQWRAEQMANAAKEDLNHFPIVHEGDKGFKIHELKLPQHESALPEGYKIQDIGDGLFEVYDKEGNTLTPTIMAKSPESILSKHNYRLNKDKLDRALKNEGEQMGHCVGGYTNSVASGESRIFSLRDEKGGAHATVEAIPNKEYVDGINPPWEGAPFDIHQIKGKGNGAVSDKYRTYIKDWLNKEADKIGQAQDLDNIGVIDLKNGIIRRENLDPKIVKALESGELKRFASDDEIKHIMTRPEVQEQSFNSIKNGIPTSLKKITEDLANKARNEHPNANIEFATTHNGIIKGGDYSVPSSSLNLQPNGTALHTHGYDERDIPSISDFEEWVKHPIQKHYGIIKPHPDTGQLASHSSVIIEPKNGFEMPTQRQLMSIQKDIYKQNPELVNRLDKGDLDAAIWKHLLDQSSSGKINLHLHNVAYPYELKAGELVDKMTPMERGQYLDHLRNETQKALDKNPEAKKFIEMYQKGNARGLNHEEINNFLRYGNTGEIPWNKPAHILRKEYGIDAFDDFIKNEAPKLDRDLTLFRATDELPSIRNSKTSGQHFGYLSTSINPDITNALLANESWNRLKGAKTTTHVIPKGSSVVAPNVHNDLEWQKEIILPRHNPVKKSEGFKKGGRIKMNEGGTPELTPAQMRDALFAESREYQAEKAASEPRTLQQRMIDQGRLPAKGGVSGGGGYVPGSINPFNPDSPLNRKNGGKIPSIDEMRLTIIRKK